MALVSTEEIKAGMSVEKDVKNSHGQLLIRGGTDLTERHLTLIRSWGITEIHIKGEGQSNKELLDLQDIKPENFAKAEGLLQGKFVRAGMNDPVMKELFRHCAARKAKTFYG